MKRSSMLVVAVALLIGVALSSAAANHGPDFQKMQQVMAELNQKSGQDFEVGYINAIIPHHQDAIAMAKLVKDTAPHQETRAAAAKMITDQEKEIGDLSGWLKQWYGLEVSPDPRMAMDSSMMDMLKKLDPEMQEKHFLAMMREHHQSAIDMGKLVVSKATHQELKDQGQMMMTMQKDEQDRMGGWLMAWYGITPPAPTGDMLHGMEAVMPPPAAPTMAPATSAPTSAPTAAPAGGVPGSLPNTGAPAGSGWWPLVALLALVGLGTGFLVRRSARRI
jgi:LPXTG-motif cell wall-anchored protein